MKKKKKVNLTKKGMKIKRWKMKMINQIKVRKKKKKIRIKKAVKKGKIRMDQIKNIKMI